MQSAVQRGLNLANNIQASTMKPAGGTALSHDGQGAVTITTDGDRVVYTMQLSCTEQNEVFCARDNDDNRLVVFVDDGSEVTLIAASVVSKEWEESAGEQSHEHWGQDQAGRHSSLEDGHHSHAHQRSHDSDVGHWLCGARCCAS